MIKVVTGSDKLKFRCQGQLANSEKPIRVSLNHDIQVKLNEGSLKIYKEPAPKPTPAPAPKVEKPVKVEGEKKETKKS